MNRFTNPPFLHAPIHLDSKKHMQLQQHISNRVKQPSSTINHQNTARKPLLPYMNPPGSIAHTHDNKSSHTSSRPRNKTRGRLNNHAEPKRAMGHMRSSDWIAQHYLELQRQYPRMYVAVKGGKVIAHGESLSRVLEETRNVDCTIELIQSGELFAYQAHLPS